MKSASVSDLHTKTSELVRNAAEGEVIVIEQCGQLIAELRPISIKEAKVSQEQNKFELPDMAEIWNTFPQVSGDRHPSYNL